MEGTLLDSAKKSSKKCQIEGCHDITVGSRTALCRKHRNNKYKQNYNKKKKRKAHGPEEMPSESIETQLAEEKCLMEQKYASMLQQVLAQKQLELLQSEKVIQVLRAHQQKVKQDKIREIQERKIKKEQEPKEAVAQESAVSKIPSEAPSTGTAKDSTTEKPHPKTKTSKKSNQSKKSPGKAVMPKDVRIGNNLNFSGNMLTVSKPPSSSSNLETKSLYTEVSISPSLGTNIVSYVGQNPRGLNNGQPMTMTIQRVPKIDSMFSYQPNALRGVGNSSSYTKICIDSVKDLSLRPPGSDVTSVETSSNQPQPTPGASKQMSSSDTNNFVMLNSKTMQSMHIRLPQNPPPYQAIQKGNLSGVNVTSQGNHEQSFQGLMTPCTLAAVTSGGNLATAIGMAQQGQVTFPLLNFSQAMSLSNSQITTSGIYTQVPQTSQGIMSQNWSNHIMTGRAQTPAIQDDFLFQMLQENKDPQVHSGAQSQTNSALSSLDHVMSDQSWTMNIGM